MSEDWFLKLKECDSLLKMRFNHLRVIREQEDRLSQLEARQKDNFLQTEKLRQEHVSLEESLYELEKKLKVAQEQKNRLTDMGGDENKIRAFQEQIQVLETEGLSLLDAIEANDKNIHEAKQFGDGIARTMQEIGQEVSEAKANEEKELKNIDMRLGLLEEELPPDFRETFKKTKSKNLALGPFTRVESGSCFICRYKISRLEESEIDMQKRLKQCPQCTRIFLPYGS